MNESAMPALYAALAKAQAKFQPIEKNREVLITMKSGGKYKFRYADIEEITSKTRPALTAEGLAVIQPVQSDPSTGATWIETILMHADGGTIKSRVDIKPVATYSDPKEFGAAVTYCRRYAITSMLGVCADDDLDQNGKGVGDQGAPDAGDEVSRVVDELIAGARATKTDADALAYWKANNAKLAKFPNAFDEFKQAVAKHRKALAQTEGAAA